MTLKLEMSVKLTKNISTKKDNHKHIHVFGSTVEPCSGEEAKLLPHLSFSPTELTDQSDTGPLA